MTSPHRNKTMPEETKHMPSQDVADSERSGDRRLSTCSASSVPLGKRGPIEMHVGMIRCAVIAQCEPDGRWAARVPSLTEHCEMGSTREEAIQFALKAVSVVSPQNVSVEQPAPTQNDDN